MEKEEEKDLIEKEEKPKIKYFQFICLLLITFFVVGIGPGFAGLQPILTSDLLEQMPRKRRKKLWIE